MKKYFTSESLQTGNEDEAAIAALIMEKLLGEKKSITTAVAETENSNWVKNRKEIC